MVNKYHPGGSILEVQFTAIAEGKERGLKCLWFDKRTSGRGQGSKGEKEIFSYKKENKEKGKS